MGLSSSAFIKDPRVGRCLLENPASPPELRPVPSGNLGDIWADLPPNLELNHFTSRKGDQGCSAAHFPDL